jgi:heptosyltransferase-2
LEQKLLVRVPNWLGDCMMSMRALSGIVAEWPETAFWSSARVALALPAFFPGTEVIPSEARPVGFGRLLLLADSFRSALQGWRAGIGERLGHRGQLRCIFLTRSLRPLPGRNHHHSLDYERLASFAGAEPRDAPPPAAEPEGPAHIAVFAGAAYGPAKIWPGFGTLFGYLRMATGLEPVLYGTAMEDAGLRRLASSSPGASVMTSLQLDSLCRRLRAASLAIGNDSGGVHLAAALGVPTIALYGSTNPVWTAPLGKAVRVLSGSAPCSPCFRRTCRRGDMFCFSRIGVETVAEAAMDLLA